MVLPFATRPITAGVAFTLAKGRELKVVVKITPTRSLVHAATGARFKAVTESFEGILGREVVFGLMPTDRPGWIDEITGNLIDVSEPDSHTHLYTGEITLTDEKGTLVGNAITLPPFPVPSDDMTPIDLDRLLPSITVEGTQISIPDTWSTLVAQAQAAAAAAEQAVGPTVTTAVSAAVGAVVDQIDEAVADAEQARDDVQAVVATNDGIMTTVAQDENSTFHAELSATYAGLPRPGQNALTGWYHATGYGAVSGGSAAVNTAAIQAAIDDAASGSDKGKVWIPQGDYPFTQLRWKRGVHIFGAGVSGFGTPNTVQGTRLRQASGQNRSAIIYDEPVSGSGYTYAGPAGIRDLEVALGGASTAGYGIDFTTPDGTGCTVQDTLVLENLLVRGFPSGGINFPAGGLPLHVYKINLLYNGGPGIRYVKGAGSTQAIHFDNISGDGNAGGLIYIDNGGIDVGQFLITNLKSEQRANSAYSAAAAQENAIVLHNCPAPVVIVNANHWKSVDDGSVVGPLVKATGTAHVDLDWRGINTASPGGAAGTSLLLDDTARSLQIEALRRQGTYTSNGRVYEAVSAAASGAVWAYGRLGYAVPSVLTHSLGVSGPTPGLWIHESDAPLNEKLWAWIASGGDLSLRTLTDSGAAGMLVMEVTRNASSAPVVRFASSRVEAAELESVSATGALVLKSPNGTRWRVTVSDAGALSVSAA